MQIISKPDQNMYGDFSLSDMKTSCRKKCIYMYGILFFCCGTTQTAQQIKFNSTDFECTKNATLTCTSEFPNSNIALFTESDKLVDCSFGSCDVKENLPKDYSVSHNFSSGKIVLIVNNVSLNTEDKTFRCEGHSQWLILKPKVKVYPSVLIIYVDTTYSTTIIHATTDCVKLLEVVRFTWIKSTSRAFTNWSLIATDTDFNFEETLDKSLCIPEEHCNGTGYSSRMSFPKAREGLGVPYFIKCLVSVENRVIENSTEAVVYLPVNNPATTGFHYAIIFGTTLAAFVFLAVMFFLCRRSGCSRGDIWLCSGRVISRSFSRLVPQTTSRR